MTVYCIILYYIILYYIILYVIFRTGEPERAHLHAFSTHLICLLQSTASYSTLSVSIRYQPGQSPWGVPFCFFLDLGTGAKAKIPKSQKEKQKVKRQKIEIELITNPSPPKEKASPHGRWIWSVALTSLLRCGLLSCGV